MTRRSLLWVMLLVGCGARPGAGSDGGTDTPDGGASADGEHPLVYLNDTTLGRLQGALGRGDESAVRFRDLVESQMAGGDIYAFEPWYAALLGRVTEDERQCAYAVAQTDARVQAEEELIATTHRASVAGDSYLEVGAIIGGMALVYDFCFDGVTAAQRERWIAYGNQAVANVWDPEGASWGGEPAPWSGWSIDNPANNYYYSFLRATMLLGLATRGENDRAEEWLRIFRDEKIRDQLVPLFERDLVGGGSREGTGYGTALGRLFELYDLWEQSTGERIADLTSHTRASLPHMLHAIVPTGEYLVPVGDHSRDSTAAFFDYHRLYLLVLAYLYRGDVELSGVARSFLRHGPLPQMQNGFMAVYDFLYDDAEAPEQPLSNLYPAYYGSGTGQFYFRSSWEPDATLVHVIGGPFTESHAHEDQGSLMIFHRQWLAYDANVESHSGIEQAPELHNLVRLVRAEATIPQVREQESSRVIGLADEAAFSWVAVDTAPIYAADDVRSVRRDVVFLKPSVIVVLDRVDVGADVRAIWQLNAPVAPSVTDSTVSIDGASSDLRVHRVLGGESASVIDWASLGIEVNGGYRLELSGASGAATFLHVLAIDGAVTSASATGSLGVDIALADGTHARVDFAAGTVDAPDGTRATLAEAIESLPLFAP